MALGRSALGKLGVSSRLTTPGHLEGVNETGMEDVLGAWGSLVLLQVLLELVVSAYSGCAWEVCDVIVGNNMCLEGPLSLLPLRLA